MTTFKFNVRLFSHCGSECVCTFYHHFHPLNTHTHTHSWEEATQTEEAGGRAGSNSWNNKNRDWIDTSFLAASVHTQRLTSSSGEIYLLFSFNLFFTMAFYLFWEDVHSCISLYSVKEKEELHTHTNTHTHMSFYIHVRL